MTALYCRGHLSWCQQQMHWNLNLWRNLTFTNESRFCLWQLDRQVKVWSGHSIHYANCCIERVTSFGGGSVMVWGGISLTGKTGLVIIGGYLNADIEMRYNISTVWDWTLSSKMATPTPTGQGVLIDYLQNLNTCGRVTRVTNITMLADLWQMLGEEWDVTHSSVWLGWWPAWVEGARLLWFFNMLLRLLFVKLPICLVSSDFNHPIHQRRFGKIVMGLTHIISSAAHGIE